MRRRLVVFLKLPRLGAVKTRLARDVGVLAAWRFQRDTARLLVRRLQADPRWRVVLSIAPDRLAGGDRLLPAGPRERQGGGDLGQRMARALERGGRGPAVLVGTDVPALGPEQAARAFQLLRTRDAVFGPAGDGGFWLVGFRRRGLARRAFRDVRWSGPHALADVLANLPPTVTVGLLAPLDDVDTGADLARARPAGGRRPGRPIRRGAGAR